MSYGFWLETYAFLYVQPDSRESLGYADYAAQDAKGWWFLELKQDEFEYRLNLHA